MTDSGNTVPRLSLIIPAYNEAARLGHTLDLAIAYLDTQPYASEIVVVDDGSVDETVSVARAHSAARTGVRVVSLAQNSGKGAAVRRGMLHEARGAVRLFYDADAATPIEEVGNVWPLLDAGAEIVIGSRALPASQVLVHQRWYREQMGKLNNRILRALGITRFADTQCGFKAFTAHACDVVFPRQTIERFSFDAELLYIAHKHGLRITELPVHWINSASSRLNPIVDAPRMVLDLMTIRLKDLLGRYR